MQPVVEPFAQYLLQELGLYNPNEKGFSLHNGLIKQNSKFWIGDNVAAHIRLLQTFHASSVRDHSGV